MALTDENGGGFNVSMPVQPMNYGNGNWGGYGVPYAVPVAGGFGGYGNGFGDDFGGLIVLFLIAAMFGGFGGGWGGFGMGGFGGEMFTFPWLLNGQAGINANTNEGFNNAALATQISGLRSDVTGGFSDTALSIAGLSRQVCETGGNVTAAVTGAQNAVAQQLYNNEINSLNRSFAAQTAVDNRLDSLDMSLQKCCCDNQLATESLRYTVATENAADRAALSDGIRDVITAQTAGTQRILDKLCDQELQAERRENDQLRTQLNMANLAASQAAQTAQLVADNTAQTQYIVNRVAPYPIPAYPVNNPYGCGGYGWNNGFNNFGGNFGFNPFGNVGFGNGSF